VPAAGRGSRLGGSLPKLLAPLGHGATVWSVLSRKLLAVTDHISLIVSPAGFAPLRAVIERDGLGDRVSLSLQPTPAGMGDAIFCGAPAWSRAAFVLVVWGDQAFVSVATLAQACAMHNGDATTIVLPLVEMARPYVEYQFDDGGRLGAIRQSREGDACSGYGSADIGTFVLSVPGLMAHWCEYRATSSTGALTGEINFLPFLTWLAARGWAIKRLSVVDPREARGINTPEDLMFFQSIMNAQ
jgi:bifunctional UDP-N-acetylglucosamine pyrophosphorylase / glucosamine-1-phosphate N-acetyltransferase